MRKLSVVIYDAAGDVVRWRSDTADVQQLRFSSALPGGFMQCSFSVGQLGARSLPLQAGQVVIVRRGLQVVWWGWLEDVETLQRGAMDQIAVRALGPWQQLQQRLVTASYDDVTSTYIVRDMLAAYCPDVAQDYSQLVNSGTPLTTNEWTNAALSDVIAAVCDTGDASSRPLLFALWEPPGSRVRLGETGNLTDDPEFEQEEVYWSADLSDIYLVWSATVYHSARYAWRWREGAVGGVLHKRRIPVSGAAVYVIDYWLYWTAYSSMTMSARFDWYGAAGYISTSYSTTMTSDGTTTGWQHVVHTVTSPAGATGCQLSMGGSVGTGGGVLRYQAVDDVRMYLYTTAIAEEAKPRAYLWARDLSDYDYTLRTADLDPGLQRTVTTRDLANAVLASYSSSSFTAVAENAASQALYRRRDHLVAAGNVALVNAQAQRDVYLATHAGPGTEINGFRLDRPGAVRTAQGLAVDPALLRAGDRLKIVDGHLAGTVIMLSEVEWSDGVATCRPESYEDLTRVLARV